VEDSEGAHHDNTPKGHPELSEVTVLSLSLGWLRSSRQEVEMNERSAINASIHAELLRTCSTVIRDAVKGGALKIGAGVYDLATGTVPLS